MVRKTSCFLLVALIMILSSCNYSRQPESESKAARDQGTSVSSVDQANKMHRLVMGWNAFGDTDTYIQLNSVSPSLNVVSPRWYTLDEQDLVRGTADSRYIEWAHDSGRQVWAFFGNRFDPELTDTLIGNRDNHAKIAGKLEDELVRNKVDGINIDFENIKMDNKEDFVAFVRQLKDTLAPHGIIVSVDVTRENPDPFWSGSYDRKGLGKAADYIVMMGYDEDLGGGGNIGSVASLSWVEVGLQRLLQEVPSRKVILAIPFYTREWITNLTTNEVTHNDRTMREQDAIIKEKGLKKQWESRERQNYVEYTENNEKHQIWVEDEESLKQRLELVDKYDLKGVAAWYIGQETPSIWPVFGSK